jgi:ketopantoate reductase/GNAT superfamily N-acetyltransferase
MASGREGPAGEAMGVRVCVLGAGAMGGLVGARLVGAGAEVTLVDHADRVAQLRQRGLRLITAEGDETAYGAFRAVDAASTTAAEPQDIIVLAVKAYDLPAVASQVSAWCGPDTVILTLQNGIPWWYFHGLAGPFSGHRLRSVDPDGILERHIDPARVIGCIPYPAAQVLPDGSVKHVEGDRMPVGELDGSTTARVSRVAAILESAGFRSRILDDVRSETWLKAWGNLSFNPISALTGATMEDICRFGPTRDLAAAMMAEAQRVAEALGATLRVSIEKRIRGAEAVGPHKTSMLQDLEAGRRLETDALVGAMLEIAELVGIDVPSIRAVHAAVALLERRLAPTPAPQALDDEVVIRPMRADDLPAATAILEQWNMAPTPDEPDAERSGIIVEHSFVAERGGRLVGTASYLMLAPDHAETASLAVDPECRGLGVGYKLQVARLEAMWRRGVRRVRTETDRDVTIDWYIRKFGYVRTGTNPKKHDFSLPDVHEWTVLELDLAAWAAARAAPRTVPT